jgi:hypothetical protein
MVVMEVVVDTCFVVGKGLWTLFHLEHIKAGSGGDGR